MRYNKTPICIWHSTQQCWNFQVHVLKKTISPWFVFHIKQFFCFRTKFSHQSGLPKQPIKLKRNNSDKLNKCCKFIFLLWLSIKIKWLCKFLSAFNNFLKALLYMHNKNQSNGTFSIKKRTKYYQVYRHTDELKINWNYKYF